MHYDLTDLRLFLHVGETRNLTRAAERAFLSPPAASMRIKQLEENFHTPLLLRQAKGVQLTPAGERMLEHIRMVFNQLECMHSAMQPFASGVKGRVRLLANSTAASTFLPGALSAFLAEHPDIDIELEECSSREAAVAVVKGAADIAMVAGHVMPEELDVLPLYRDELVLIGSPLLGPRKEGPVRLAELLDSTPFVGLNQHNSIHSFVDGIARQLGKRINLRIQVGNFDAVCRMVEAGAGVAVVPLICAQQYGLKRLRVMALDEPWARRDISLVRLRSHTLPRSSELLIEHLRQQVRALVGEVAHE
ncbi:LysR family transcriptional regulator [Variovorax sp. KK3]|uniref:LysR family transcriptional regulator n=1 Tax=Variovorax sp. KK3 TaxID=1855728 RepID=UPI00097BEFCB|nr:LysR family transcriptional regulator [Variovorax sp. KK3]